jgi:hypothetical protein
MLNEISGSALPSDVVDDISWSLDGFGWSISDEPNDDREGAPAPVGGHRSSEIIAS